MRYMRNNTLHNLERPFNYSEFVFFEMPFQESNITGSGLTDQMLSREEFLSAIKDFDPLAAPASSEGRPEITKTASQDMPKHVEIEVEIRPRVVGVSTSKSFSVIRTVNKVNSSRFSIRRSHHASFAPNQAKVVLSMTSSRSDEDDLVTQIAEANESGHLVSRLDSQC